jgi:CheY-like chemotaxis protein
MTDQPILPYFHPSTIVIVDDNALFLHTLDLRMPAESSYQLFHDARVALDRVNQRTTLAPIADRFLAGVVAGKPAPEAHLSFELVFVEEEIKYSDRFSRASVVIVDYSMPEMTGLEFCAGIRDPAVKKVLLTGVADEKVAVKAFNDGVIDRFLPKQGDGALDEIVRCAVDMQRSYFVDQQRVLMETLSLSPAEFLDQPSILEAFAAIRTRLHIVEHYVVDNPPGLLLFSSEGNMYRWVVMSEQELAAQAERASRSGAPQDVVGDLSAGTCIGDFHDLENGDIGSYAWKANVHRSAWLEGRHQRWATALIADPSIDVDFDPKESAFGAFLDRTDQLAVG